MIKFFVIKNDEVIGIFDTLVKAMNYVRYVSDGCFILNGFTGKIWKF